MKLYITFYTTAEAMATSKLSKEENLGGRLVPIPRTISSSCGMAYEIDISLKERVMELLKERDIEWEHIAEL